MRGRREDSKEPEHEEGGNVDGRNVVSVLHMAEGSDNLRVFGVYPRSINVEDQTLRRGGNEGVDVDWMCSLHDLTKEIKNEEPRLRIRQYSSRQKPHHRMKTDEF